jgi:hypothetical protein
LQYDYELHINAYLDVPYDPPPIDRDHATANTVKSVTYGAPTRGHHAIDEEETEQQVRDPNMPVSVSDKLESLRRLGSNWETLDWASQRSITVDGPARIYELQEGIFLMCERFGNDDEGGPVGIANMSLMVAHHDTPHTSPSTRGSMARASITAPQVARDEVSHCRSYHGSHAGSDCRERVHVGYTLTQLM